MALQNGQREIIEILHTFILQDNIADLGVPGHLLKFLLDVNNPAGALVFVCAIGGILIVFIAILDSLKPPNFPPGPRWLPFGGDNSGLCEKPLTNTTATRLVEQFGPVVGLRPSNAPRNPLVLTLDAASTEIVEDAARNGFLECQNDCPQRKISGYTGISSLYINQIVSVFLTKDIKKSVEICVQEATSDLFEVLQSTSEQPDRSLVSITCLAALLNVMTGYRVKPTSRHLTRLYRILMNASKYNYILKDNEWADISSYSAQYYSQLIVVLSDIEECEMSELTESSRPTVFRILGQNNRLTSLPEKGAVLTEIFLRANTEGYSSVIDEVFDSPEVQRLQSRTEGFLDPSTKNACHELHRGVIYEIARNIPTLRVACRWKVLKSFYLNGFTVPQGAEIQSILSGVEYHHASGEQRSPEDILTDLSNRVLSEIVCCSEAVKIFTAIKMM